MSFPSGIKLLASAALLGATLAGCSDLYTDRRDGISYASGEAMAANRVALMIDPWPPASRQRNIAYNGEKMQTAAERYRTGRIIPPVSATTSTVAAPAAAPPLPPPPPPPAAAIKP
jgi:hypothetical protein